jgi:anti-anti-sigma factor
MASLGMRMLLRCSRALKGTGGKMVLLKPQPLVEQALKVACLDQVFGIEQDEARAMEALKAQ